MTPNILKIEVTTRCNANCIFCSHRFLNKKHLKDMPFDTVKMLIDQTNWRWKPEIQLSGFGEPTLYPDLVKAVRYCHKKGLKSSFNTNGFLLTRDLMDQLIKAGLSQFRFAIDGYSKKTYESLRRGLNFETVLYNALDAWGLCRKSKTRMIILNVICKENENEFILLKDFWSRHSHKFEVNQEMPFVQGRVEQFYSDICDHFWTQMQVRVNGDVVICCLDFPPNYTKLGNVYETPLLEIYNSPSFNKLRLNFKKSIYPDVCYRYCVRK